MNILEFTPVIHAKMITNPFPLIVDGLEYTFDISGEFSVAVHGIPVLVLLERLFVSKDIYFQSMYCSVVISSPATSTSFLFSVGISFPTTSSYFQSKLSLALVLV
jgi:hypothetical protein